MHRPKATEFSLDWGSLAHFLFGFLGGLLDASYLFTGIFVFKQYMDWRTGEEWPETSGDVAEFSSGLVVGLIAKQFLLPFAVTPFAA